jgi:uncharacterized protein YbjT (DUF2867 family)
MTTAIALFSPQTSEFGAFVHVDDVATATLLALTADIKGHHRLTLCGPEPFDTTPAAKTLDGERPGAGTGPELRPARGRR